MSVLFRMIQELFPYITALPSRSSVDVLSRFLEIPGTLFAPVSSSGFAELDAVMNTALAAKLLVSEALGSAVPMLLKWGVLVPGTAGVPDCSMWEVAPESDTSVDRIVLGS